MPVYQIDYQIKKYGTMEVKRDTEQEAIEAAEEMLEGDGEIENIEAIKLRDGSGSCFT